MFDTINVMNCPRIGPDCRVNICYESEEKGSCYDEYFYCRCITRNLYRSYWCKL